MEPKELMNQYTRKEMNGLANTLGLDSPEGFPNKEALAESMLEEWSKLKNDIKGLKSTLKEFRDSEVDISAFKITLKSLIDNYGDENIPETLDIFNDVKEQSEQILMLNSLISGTRESIGKVKDEGKREEFDSKLTKLTEACKDGDYRMSLEECEKLKLEVDLTLKSHKKFENELLEHLEKAKEKLASLRETTIEIGHIKDLVRDAVNAHRDGNLQKSFDHVKEALESSESILKVFEKIEEGKKKVQRLKERDSEINSYLEVLKRGKKKADEKDYQYAMQLLDDALMEMERDLKDDIKEAEKKVNDTSLKVKNIYKKIVAIEKALQYVKKDLEDLDK